MARLASLNSKSVYFIAQYDMNGDGVINSLDFPILLSDIF